MDVAMVFDPGKIPNVYDEGRAGARPRASCGPRVLIPHAPRLISEQFCRSLLD